MKIDWAYVFEAGVVIVYLTLAALGLVLLFFLLPWIIMNWILVAGVALLIGLTLIGIAYYMDFVRKEVTDTNE